MDGWIEEQIINQLIVDFKKLPQAFTLIKGWIWLDWVVGSF